LISYYLKLQKTRIERWCIEIGLHPILSYFVVIVGFFAFVELLYYKTDHAPLILSFLSLYFIQGLSDNDKTEFLQRLSQNNYRQIRLAENMIACVPASIILFVKGNILIGLVHIVLCILLSQWRRKSSLSRTYQNWFSKYPFEFTSGIRLLFPISLLAYFLCFMSIENLNFNLGAFALGLGFVVSMWIYAYQKAQYFIWLFNCSIQEFIKRKFKTAVYYSLIIYSLIIIVLAIYFPHQWLVILLMIIAGILNILNMIVIKYAAYPREYGLIQTLSIIFCVLMPPLTIISIPYYYNKLSLSLKAYLS